MRGAGGLTGGMWSHHSGERGPVGYEGLQPGREAGAGWALLSHTERWAPSFITHSY